MKKLALLITVTIVIVGFNSKVFAQWQYNGNDIFYNGGNVGIGIDLPAKSLHVKGNLVDPDGTIVIEAYQTSGSERDPKIMFNDGDGSELSYIMQGIIGTGVPVNLKIWNKKNGDIMFATNNNNVVNITKDGNLEIVNSNNGIILTSPDGGKWLIKVDNNGNLLTSSVTLNSKIKNDNKIKIYPNPVNDRIRIDFQTKKNQFKIVELYDIAGKKIYMRSFTTNIIYLNINDYKNGIYFIKIKDEKNNIIKTEKIIKR